MSARQGAHKRAMLAKSDAPVKLAPAREQLERLHGPVGQGDGDDEHVARRERLGRTSA